jgi:uncharacterized membrane protein YfcA
MAVTNNIGTINKPVLFSISLAIIVWCIWYSYTNPNSLDIIEKNWPITLTMVFGSFIAGATSEGGGAIAFPIFTKVLHISPQDAKVFSLAIQSIGMMAATLTIIVMRIAVEWRIILWASLGGVAGVMLGSIFVAPLLPADLLKMLFTAMIVSFALTLFLLNWKPRAYNQYLPIFGRREILILLFTGFIGGCLTGLVGNGIDIICFSVMVLLFRLSEKVSTATSVVLMAFNSLVGFTLHLLIIGGFTAQVESYWLAAIPVVVVGAPLGAYFCTRLNNKTIATILITLIMVELSSSLSLIPLTDKIVSVSLAVFLLFSFIYYQMSKVKRYSPTRIEALR